MVSGVSLVAGGADRNNARRISVARQRQSDGKGSGMTSLICSKCQTDDQWFSLPGLRLRLETHRREKIIFFKDGSIGGDKIKVFQILFRRF